MDFLPLQQLSVANGYSCNLFGFPGVGVTVIVVSGIDVVDVDGVGRVGVDVVFAGAARRAGPDRQYVDSVFVSL